MSNLKLFLSLLLSLSLAVITYWGGGACQLIKLNYHISDQKRPSKMSMLLKGEDQAKLTDLCFMQDLMKSKSFVDIHMLVYS